MEDERGRSDEEVARRLSLDAEAEFLRISEELAAQNKLAEDVAYGATAGLPLKPEKVRRVRLNLRAVAMSVLVPWLVFCFVAAARSFQLRENWSAAIYASGIATVLICAGLAYTQFQRKRSGDPGYEPMVYMFLAVTSLLAFCVALAFGWYVWVSSISRYWDYAHLNQYSNVNPFQMRGSQVMDAGLVQFVEGSFLDISKSAGFSNQKMYCVTPILVGVEKPVSYDFWAVGTDCCAGMSSSFQCGDWSNKQAREGMRVMKAADEEFYKFAVEKAQAQYQINVQHPVFFYWTGDAVGNIRNVYSQGISDYILSIFAYLFFQGFLFVCFYISVAKEASKLAQAAV